ncbi:MAG: MBL fold metallo-hydrolase [Thermoleophilia bacterium]
MRITVCGSRGSTPSPGPGTVRYGGETTSLAVGNGGAPRLILDAGTGLRNFAGLVGDASFRGAMVLTHLHWDHTHGLPFFGPGDRDDAAVELLLPEQGVPAAELLGRAMSPPHFPIGPAGLRGDWSFGAYDEGGFEAGGFRITAREVPHGGGRTMGLRVDGDGRSIAFIPDHAPHFAGPGDHGVGELHPAVLELADGVDLLIHDAQYTAEELPARAAFGHSAFEYSVALAERAGAGRLLLFHHDPTRDDDALDALLARARAKAAMPVDAATEGAVIDV